jgi:hypothetical protein
LREKGRLPECTLWVLEVSNEPIDWKGFGEVLLRLDTPWFFCAFSGDDWQVADSERLRTYLQKVPDHVSCIALSKGPAAKIRRNGERPDAEPMIWRTKALANEWKRQSLLVPDRRLYGYELGARFEPLGKVDEYPEVCGLRPIVLRRDLDQVKTQILTTLLTSQPFDSEHPPAITVLLCAFNEATRIRWAIRSMLAQTYPNWELLVLDDGSTDGTARIAAAFKDPRMTVVRFETNRGKASVLNEGLTRASAPLLLELDADDWLPPTAIERFVQTAQTITSQDREIGMFSSAYYLWQKRKWGLHFQGVRSTRQFQCTNEYAAPPIPRVYRTEMVREVGGWPIFPDRWGALFEDVAMCRRLLQRYRLEVLAEPLYHRVLRSDSISQSNMHLYRRWEEATRDS